jgi:hypothetical protein
MKWEQLPLKLKTKPKWELVPSKQVSKKLPPIIEIPRVLHTPTYTPTTPTNTSVATGNLNQILGNIMAIDFEWTNNEIYAYCATDIQGNTTRMHLDDNEFKGDRTKFIHDILNSIVRYDTIVGYGISLDTTKEWSKDSIDGDWKMLEVNCEQVGLLSKLELVHSKVKLLDACRIYSNKAIIGMLGQNNIKYLDRNLDTVAQSILGIGKLDGVSGDNVESANMQVQLDYCLRDSQLALSLLTNNNYEMLHILYNVSNYIGLDFFSTCNATGPSTWWKYFLYTKLKCPRMPYDVYQWVEEHSYNEKGEKVGVDFTGGEVLDTQPGFYINAYLFDVLSMYPTQIDFRNLCPSSINCRCHKNDLTSRVSDSIMRLVNLELKKPRPWNYWICPNRGILSDVMKNLVAEKQEYKRQSNKKMEKAIKLLMNSGFGILKYLDVRLADLITGYSRQTLLGLSDRIRELGGIVLMGDTDSVGFTECRDIDTLTSYAKDIYGVTFTLDKFWSILFVTPLKKQYFGILKDGTIHTKTLTGMKDDKPAFFKDVLNNLVSMEYLEPFITHPDRAQKVILKYVQNVYRDLEKGCKNLEFIKNKLAFSEVSNKNMNKYTSGSWNMRAYNEMLNICTNNADLAQKKTLKGRAYKRWKLLIPSEKMSKNGITRKIKSTTTYCIEQHYKNIDIQKYKDELWKCLSPLLIATKIDVIQIVKELGVKVGKEKKAS